MICLKSSMAVPLVYELSFLLNTFYLTMTRSAEKFLNSRAVSTDRIRRSGFLPTSEHGFGIGNVLRPDHVSAVLRPTTDGIMSAWSFEIGRNCDIGRIRNFLDTLGIVASVLSRFQVSENESGLSQLLTIGGISSHVGDSTFALNITLSHEVMASWRHPIDPRLEARLTEDLPATIRRHVWNGSTFEQDIPGIRRSEDGHIESIVLGGSGAGLERCRQFFSGHGAIFCQRNITSLEQQVLMLCLMSELAALTRTS